MLDQEGTLLPGAAIDRCLSTSRHTSHFHTLAQKLGRSNKVTSKGRASYSESNFVLKIRVWKVTRHRYTVTPLDRRDTEVKAKDNHRHVPLKTREGPDARRPMPPPNPPG